MWFGLLRKTGGMYCLISQRHEGAGLYRKKHRKKHLCRHDKNYCYFYKSNIPVINLIVGSRKMIKVSKNTSCKNYINNESRF